MFGLVVMEVMTLSEHLSNINDISQTLGTIRNALSSTFDQCIQVLFDEHISSLCLKWPINYGFFLASLISIFLNVTYLWPFEGTALRRRQFVLQICYFEHSLFFLSTFVPPGL